jgi:hypothetical protein
LTQTVHRADTGRPTQSATSDLARFSENAHIDRLVHHSVVLELNVPSYRAEQAKKRKNTDI